MPTIAQEVYQNHQSEFANHREGDPPLEIDGISQEGVPPGYIKLRGQKRPLPYRSASDAEQALGNAAKDALGLINGRPEDTPGRAHVKFLMIRLAERVHVGKELDLQAADADLVEACKWIDDHTA